MPVNSFYFEWELNLLAWLQSAVPTPLLDAISQLSLLCDSNFSVLLVALLYWCVSKDLGTEVAANVLVGQLWNTELKNIFCRRRPYFETDRIQFRRLIDPKADPFDVKAQGYSFPSGHSTNATALYGTLARRLTPKLWPLWWFILPLLVGVSRMAVGAHYPTDVAVGWALGLLPIFLLPKLKSYFPSPLAYQGILLVTVLPGVFYCRTNDYYSCLGLYIGLLLLAQPFEQRYVKFENTRHPLRIAVRTACGMGVFLGVTSAAKLPVSAEFLDGGSRAALLYRGFRYALGSFAAFGLYPMVFRYLDNCPLWRQPETGK